MAKKEMKIKVGKLLPDDWTLTGIIFGGRDQGKRQRIEQFKREHPEAKEMKLSFDGLAISQLESGYLSMKGIKTKNLKLRYSMAKYLLRLVEKDRHISVRMWQPYPNCLEPIMSEYLGTELQRIVRELEGKL